MILRRFLLPCLLCLPWFSFAAVPVSVRREFESGLKKVGARGDAHAYPMAGQGWFKRDSHFTLTLIETDKFLASLGWIQGPPMLSLPVTKKSNPIPTP